MIDVRRESWAEAERRFSIIAPLLALHRLRRRDVELAARDGGHHVATIYRWLKCFRTSGELSSLLPTTPDGGRGRSRLGDHVEALISDVVREATNATRGELCTAIISRCEAAGLHPPHA